MATLNTNNRHLRDVFVCTLQSCHNPVGVVDVATQSLRMFNTAFGALCPDVSVDRRIAEFFTADSVKAFIQLVKWFINEKRMVVFVESAVMNDPVLVRNPEFGHIQEKLMTFNEQKDDLTDKIDFCCCLGGDGTLLYASSLFQQSVPPIMAFHLGSLGFLTPFKFEDFESQVTHVLEGHAALTLRSRLRCILIKKEEEEKGLKPSTNQLVLNEVVIDRLNSRVENSKFSISEIQLLRHESLTDLSIAVPVSRQTRGYLPNCLRY